jgi:hypothetical protein
MIREIAVESVFPAEAEIPARFNIDPPCHRTEYLVGGKLRS